MKSPPQINQGGAKIQERQPQEQTGSHVPASDNDPTAGDEAQNQRDKMQHQEKAEGD